MPSIPVRNEVSPKRPWSTATSKQRPSPAKSLLSREFMPTNSCQPRQGERLLETAHALGGSDRGGRKGADGVRELDPSLERPPCELGIDEPSSERVARARSVDRVDRGRRHSAFEVATRRVTACWSQCHDHFVDASIAEPRRSPCGILLTSDGLRFAEPGCEQIRVRERGQYSFPPPACEDRVQARLQAARLCLREDLGSRLAVKVIEHERPRQVQGPAREQQLVIEFLCS